MIYVCVQRQYLTADCEWKYVYRRNQMEYLTFVEELKKHILKNEKWNIS